MTEREMAFKWDGSLCTCKVCGKQVKREGRSSHSRKHIKDGTMVRRVTQSHGMVIVRFELPVAVAQ
jgi:hypothetical protein